MRIKRILAAVLTAALMASLAVLPAGAARSSFMDVSDETTAVNVDILRLMGIVSGVGDNRFDPNGTLTRAQFCTMVVNFLQKGDEVPRYATRTIFSDVGSGHWARGYINFAATWPVGSAPASGEGEAAAAPTLVSGVGNGQFLPDNQITLAEAATILLRALGYTGQQAGSVWPQGYINLAGSAGLLEGLDAGAYTVISRAQAAQLFVNALECKADGGKGKAYYTTLGTVQSEKAIILAVNVETDDGRSQGAIRTTVNKAAEAFLPARGSGDPTALQGKRGDLVLNENGEIVVFIPDDSTAATIVLGSDAEPAYLKSSEGRQYAISSTTTVYLGAGQESKDYSSAYSSLTAGTQITMYSEKGKITAIYSASGATTIDSDAVVVMGPVNTASFHTLTGGATNLNVVKDRQSIRLSQIQPYDVVTYDQLNNTLVVSDLRMNAVYTDPTPTPKTPTKLKAAGKEFDVLQSAWDTIGDIKPGENVSLLFTADGKVAGIIRPNAQTRSTAIGEMKGGSVSIYLPNGTTLELGAVSNASSVQDGQPVVVSAGKEKFSVSRLPENRAPGALDLNKMKLGDLTVSSGVRIYEQVPGGVVTSISRDDLAMETIPTSNITSYHKNGAGIVDYIVLTDVTGSAYIYGMMVGGYKVIQEAEDAVPPSEDEDGNEIPGKPAVPEKTRYVWHLRSGSREIDFTDATSYNGSSGDMVGVVIGTPRGDADKQYTLRKVTKLTMLRNVKRSDFFESQGKPYVNFSGQTYQISDNVECYYNRTGNKVSKDNWLSAVNTTGAQRLTSIKDYSDTFTLYVDPIGKQVRVIAAN